MSIDKKYRYLYFVLLSGILILTKYLIHLNVGVGLADPSHFWYGSWRILEGDVPILDYRSYDPTRYYWAAAFMALVGDGYSVAKLSCYVIYFVGFSLSLYAVVDSVQDDLLIVIYILSSIAYMSVFFKAHEVFVSFAAILVAYLLLKRYDNNYVILYGILSGFSATIGKNFGVYIFVSFLLLYVFRRKIKNGSYTKDFSYFVFGNVLGFSPIAILSVFYDGFLGSYIDSIAVLFSEYSPVIPLSPTPPWELAISVSSLKEIILSFAGISSNLLLFVVPIIYILTFLWLVIRFRDDKSGNELFISASVVGISILHHMIVRTDGSHLAQVVQPFMVLVLIFSYRLGLSRNKTYSVSALLYFVIIVGPLIPVASLGLDKVTGMKDAGYSWVTVGYEEFYTRNTQVYKRASNIFRDSDRVWFSPRPGMNTIFRQEIPISDPYFILLHPPQKQKNMYKRLTSSDTDTIVLRNYTLGANSPYSIIEANPLFWDNVFNACRKVNKNGYRNTIILSDCSYR